MFSTKNRRLRSESGEHGRGSSLTLSGWRRLQPGGPRVEDVLDKSLRIAIVEWEPGRLYLHHHAVTFLEHVIIRSQVDDVFVRLIRFDWLRIIEPVQVSGAKNLVDDH